MESCIPAQTRRGQQTTDNKTLQNIHCQIEDDLHYTVQLPRQCANTKPSLKGMWSPSWKNCTKSLPSNDNAFLALTYNNPSLGSGL